MESDYVSALVAKHALTERVTIVPVRLVSPRLN
jgi:hypothetical protein